MRIGYIWVYICIPIVYTACKVTCANNPAQIEHQILVLPVRVDPTPGPNYELDACETENEQLKDELYWCKASNNNWSLGQ